MSYCGRLRTIAQITVRPDRVALRGSLMPPIGVVILFIPDQPSDRKPQAANDRDRDLMMSSHRAERGKDREGPKNSRD